MSPRLRLVPAVLLLTFLAACDTPQEPDADPVPSAPVQDLASALPPVPDANVLIVSFDALRADALGLYGYERGTSPNLDRFAQEAVVFERAYSAAPVTPTSFAAAFSSKLPFRVFHRWNMVSDSSLAQAFQASEYSTTAAINNSQVTEERNFNLGFENYQVFQAISDDKVLEHGIQRLIEHKDNKFFFWLHFISPHSPYDYRTMATDFYDETYEGEFKTTTTARFESDNDRDAQRIRDLYDGEIFYADRIFGRLMDVLEQQGLLETTLIVVTADHGEEFLERGGYQHRYLNEETVRIPFIMRHPKVAQGFRTDTLYSNVDLWPTLAALTGIDPPQQTDGWNLLEAEGKERSLSSVAMTDGRYRGINLVQKNAKLILSCIPDLEVDLYNLAADPGEVQDLADTDGARVRNLLQMLRLIAGTEDPCQAIEDALAGADPTQGLDEATIESLRALGYLQ